MRVLLKERARVEEACVRRHRRHLQNRARGRGQAASLDVLPHFHTITQLVTRACATAVSLLLPQVLAHVAPGARRVSGLAVIASVAAAAARRQVISAHHTFPTNGSDICVKLKDVTVGARSTGPIRA